MGIIRLVILGLIIWLLLRLYRRFLQQRQEKSDKRPSRADQPIGEMVRCAHCKLHIPRGEAIQAGERFYCSEAHRLEDEKSR